MRVKHAAKIVTDPLTNTGRDVLLRVGADSIQQRDDYHGPTREVQNLMWFCPCSPANQGVQPSVRRPMANNIVWVLQSDRSERSVPYRNISVIEVVWDKECTKLNQDLFQEQIPRSEQSKNPSDLLSPRSGG